MAETANIEKVEPWVRMLWEQHGSDLLFSGGSPPRIRVNGRLLPIEGIEPLSGAEIDNLARPLLNPEQEATFAEQMDVDFSFSWEDKARLRGSMFTQRGETSLALRIIPTRIPSYDELGLPPAAEWLATLPRGFVLVTGPTGSGKSTTLGVDHRPHQHDALGAHPHDRGPRRVRPQPQALRGEPARGRSRQSRRSTELCAPRSERTPTSCSSVRCATSSRSRSP